MLQYYMLAGGLHLERSIFDDANNIVVSQPAKKCASSNADKAARNSH